MIKNTKLEDLENETELFYKIKKFLPVPQMTHLEKLSLCSGANL